MSTISKKIKSFTWIPLFNRYFTWLGFTSAIFILTNAISALSYIQANRFGFLDMFFTIGFLILLGLIETAILTLSVTALHMGIQKWLHRDPASILRLLVIAWFGLGWINLLLALFHRSLFRQ